MMKGQCMPRLKSNSSSSSCSSTKNKISPTTPMTLLERFREAVLRLMMLSALSRATTTNRDGERQRSNSPYGYDPHHSEAVADCIEFIKKNANNSNDDPDPDDNPHYSSACSSPHNTA